MSTQEAKSSNIETVLDSRQEIQSTQDKQTFSIENLYVKNLSLESPRTPQAFFESLQPEIDIQYSISGQKIKDQVYECTISTTVTTKLEKSVLFLCEATQGGLFHIENVEDGAIDYLMNVSCPNILFPYLRELVSECIVRAGFPPIFLAPINFEIMYHQRLSKDNLQEESAEEK